MKYAKFTKALTVVLEAEIYQQIKEISDKRRIAMAEWVRDILTKALVESGERNKLVSMTCKSES
jgi:hypothetical protein